MSRLSRIVLELLRTRVEFRRFWLGQTVSLFGDQVTYIALPLVAVLKFHANAAQMGYLTAAALVPNLLFSLTPATQASTSTGGPSASCADSAITPPAGQTRRSTTRSSRSTTAAISKRPRA